MHLRFISIAVVGLLIVFLWETDMVQGTHHLIRFVHHHRHHRHHHGHHHRHHVIIHHKRKSSSGSSSVPGPVPAQPPVQNTLRPVPTQPPRPVQNTPRPVQVQPVPRPAKVVPPVIKYISPPKVRIIIKPVHKHIPRPIKKPIVVVVPPKPAVIPRQSKNLDTISSLPMLAGRTEVLLKKLIQSFTKHHVYTPDIGHSKMYQLEADLREALNKSQPNIEKTMIGLYRDLVKYDDKVENLTRLDYLKPLKEARILRHTAIDPAKINEIYKSFENFIEKTNPNTAPAELRKEIIQQQKQILIPKLVKAIEEIRKIPNAEVQKQMTEAIKKYVLVPHNGSLQLSDQQILFDAHNVLSLRLLRLYSMLHFAYMADYLTTDMKLLEQPNPKESQMKVLQGDHYLFAAVSEGSKALKQLKALYIRSRTLLHETVSHLSKSISSTLWIRDPQIQEKGSTYLQVDKFLTGHVTLASVINPNKVCDKSCSFFKDTKIYDRITEKRLVGKETCKGRLRSCTTIASVPSICPSGINPVVSHTSNTTRKQCKTGKITVPFNERGHCSICSCLCEPEDPQLGNYIDLNEVHSNLKENRVITGIRFVKIKRVFHLQIQDGKLNAGGGIDESTVAWVPVKHDAINYKKNPKNNAIPYHKITWDRRSVHLTSEKAPKNYVLTGVRLQLTKNRLHLAIHTTRFSYVTGRLLIDTTKKPEFRSESGPATVPLTLSDPQVPILVNGSNQHDSNHSNYVEFGPSDFCTDLSQTTVPFLDSQPVVPKKIVPLSGVGLYHKGRSGSGGFIGLEIQTYNHLQHLEIVHIPRKKALPAVLLLWALSIPIFRISLNFDIRFG